MLVSVSAVSETIPYWKIIKKKTEQQKVRYIETAQRLMQDSRRASQQTLNNWRLEDEDDSSTDSEDEEASNVKTENRAVLGIDPVPIRQHQTSILEFYLATTRATASINGESRTSMSDSSSSSDGDSI